MAKRTASSVILYATGIRVVVSARVRLKDRLGVESIVVLDWIEMIVEMCNESSNNSNDSQENPKMVSFALMFLFSTCYAT